jgi:ABC-type polysaccharide/polyol phosphate export permease
MKLQSTLAVYDSTQSEYSILKIHRYFFQRKDLIALFVSRDLKSRYRRSLLGLLWTLVNPILSSLVLWLVFVSVFKAKLSNNTQFAPYLLAGVLTVTFFTQGFMQAAESISNSAALFLKIRVAPQIFVLSSALSNAVNFFLGTCALFLVCFISRSPIKPTFPLIIFVGFSMVLLTAGLGLIFGIIFVRYDDAKYIVTIILQLLTYLTPVFYPKEMLSGGTRILVNLNPLTSYLDVFRHLINGTESSSQLDWIYMFGSSSIVYLVGLVVYSKYWARSVAML